MPKSKSKQAIAIFEKDRNVIMVPDEKDIKSINKELLNILNKNFPDRKFIIKNKCSYNTTLFLVIERFDFLNEKNELIKQDITVKSFLINDLISNFLSDEMKSYLLNKYDYQLKDYTEEANDYIEQCKILIKLKSLPNEPCITFNENKRYYSFYIDTNSKWSASYKFFKTYQLNFNIITYFDYIKIKNFIEQLLKKAEIK